jgi:SAM-dependent methyltransferase
MAASSNLFTRLRRKFFLDRAGYGRPVPPAIFDGEYTSGAWAHFGHDAELARQVLVAGLAAHLHPHPAVLDLGCGSGRLAQLLQPFQPRRYLGVDISPAGLALARGLVLEGCEFVEADFESWRAPEPFETICFSECLGYARDPGALVAAFAPALTAGGHFIISYYRSGHWEAIWRRIDAHARTLEGTVVSNSRGQTWDIRVLQPLAATSGP